MIQQKIKLYDFQLAALTATAARNRCAFYLDMGLGKTFVGAEKAVSFGGNIVVVCQKSKIDDWLKHFAQYYEYNVLDLTRTGKKSRVKTVDGASTVMVINYDLIWRRDEYFSGMRGYTLLLDESSCIQNETSKRTRYICRSMRPENVILLSGTPCNGKYENLWTQCWLLGWRVTKESFWNRYIRWIETEKNGYPVKIVTGYKNVNELKTTLRQYGAVFMKTDEVFSLPEQIITDVHTATTRDYRTFIRDRIITIDNKTLVGSTPLTALLYARQIAAALNPNKYSTLADLIDSTADRLIIFYNFDSELTALKKICEDAGRKVSEVNGHRKDMTAYDTVADSVTLVQYQSGAMGLNLQLANKIVFFSPPLSCELYLQAFKRIHRIGQNRTCFYYRIIAENTVEENIYKTLEKREDYTIALFEEVRK